MQVMDFEQLFANPEFSQTAAVVSIGVYDGLHLGHQLIIRTAVSHAQAHAGWKVVVFTFAQNPKTMMGRNPFDRPLMSLRQSTDFFDKLEVDYLVVIDFSPDFSKLSGEAFVARCCSLFDVKAVVVGENFRCGAGAGTGPAELRELLPRYTKGAKVYVPRMYRTADGAIDSSTLVRNSLMQGRVSDVALLLGRNYALDLAHQPSRDSAYPLLIPIGSFVQLLPPPGLYETLLIASDRSVLATVAAINGEFLQLTVLEPPMENVGGESRIWPDRLESLLFIKELSSVC